MKLPTRIFLLVVCSLILLLSGQVSYAEEDTNVKEVIVEAIYQMGEADTPAKAEDQALLRAKRNALEQVSSLALTMENIADLPQEVFAVTVLDKKRALNGNTMECWVKIKAVVRPDKIEAAMKEAYGGRPAEYYEEFVVYDNGKQVGGVTKMWYKRDWSRTETVNIGMPGTTIYILKADKINKGVGWFICGNKYFEQPPVDPKEYEKYVDPSMKIDIKEEVLGTETIGTIVAQKKRVTSTFNKGPISKIVSLEWIDPATNLLLKQQTDGGIGSNITTIYQNRKIGPQDPTLFEIPQGFVRCAKMEDLYADYFASPQPSAPAGDPFSNLFDTFLQNQVDKVFDKVKIR